MAKRGDLDVPVMDYEFFVDADITVLNLLTSTVTSGSISCRRQWV